MIQDNNEESKVDEKKWAFALVDYHLLSQDDPEKALADLMKELGGTNAPSQ